MAEQDKDRKLDQVLDSLLAVYSDVEPRPGLETRIVARLRDQAGRNSVWNWKWTWIWSGTAIATLAMLMFIIGLESQIEPPKPRVAQADWSLLHHASESVDVAHIAKKKIQPPTENAVSMAAADTRPEVFPSPSPLSDQEKLMLRYLARTTRQEVVAQSHPDKPLEMEEPLQQQMQAPAQTEFKNSTR